MSDARREMASLLDRVISAERWMTLEPLIDEAVALTLEQRPAFLDSVCKGDAALRAELMVLLEEYDRKDSLLDRPAAERFASLFRRGPDHPPAVLGDRYRVERELGRGGTATVYLAHDIRHERKVAVKLLHPELAAAIGVERFLDEIRTTAQLHHPHILPLHDSGETDGRLFYVMPYVEGESLRRRLERERQIPIADAVRIAREVAAALDFAHRHGVIHRDIKPENILLHEGSALVADFGIALAMSAAAAPRLTTPGLIVGTPQYMSPEQATGVGAIDARTDIYALGTMLFEMLAGEPPFKGATATAVMAKRSAMSAPPVHTLRSAIPAALEAVVTRALAREPVDRYGSAGELAAALEEALDERMTSGPTVPIAPTLQSSRRWFRAAVGVLAIPVIAGIVWLLWRNGPPRPPAAAKQRVYVAAFRNRTGDSTWDLIGIEVADYTARALARTKLLEVVDPSFDVWSSPSARAARPLSAEALVRQNQATLIVSGSFYREGDSLVFGGEGFDARSRGVVFKFDGVKASVSEPRDALERVQQRVVSEIATQIDPALKAWAGNKRAPPMRFDAYQEFATGMTSFVQGIVSRKGGSAFRTHFASAQAHLGRAFRLDSTYYVAALWLIFSRDNVGDAQGADSLIRALEHRRVSMSEYEQMLYDYVVAWSSGTPEQRYELDKKLVAFAPASEYHFCLIRDAVEAGHPWEALKESQTLDDGYSWMHLMRGIPSFRVRAFVQLREFDHALETAAQARTDLPGDLSPVYPEIDALAAVERLDDIEQVVASSAAAPGVNGSDGANLMLYAGLRLESAGRMEGARRLFNRALASYAKESPDAAGREVILLGKARALYYLEQWDAARELFDTLATARPGTSRYDRKAVIYLGSLAARRGDTAEVSRLRRRLAISFPKDGEAQYFEAHAAALRGQEDRAIKWLGMAIGLGAKAWEVMEEGDATPSMDPDFAGLRRLPTFQRAVTLW